MHANLQPNQNHFIGNAKLFFTTWVWLVLLAGFEIFLAYEGVEMHLLVTILIGVSLIQSALIGAYFMHLRFERLGLFLVIVPSVVFCICVMLTMFFPDSIRLEHILRY